MEWQPVETIPTKGKFLIGVWEGEWRNPRESFHIYEASGYPLGPHWAMKGGYRTEEGGAYEVVGWMPKPPPPNLK